MNCELVTENLSAYLDRVLPHSEMECIEAHLAECSSCRQNLAELQQTIDLLASLEDVIPPASFRRELRGKIEKSASGNVRGKKFSFANAWQRLASNKFVVAPVAVAMILLIIIVPFAVENSRYNVSENQSIRDTGPAPDFVAGGSSQFDMDNKSAIMPEESGNNITFTAKTDDSMVREAPTDMKSPEAEMLNKQSLAIERKIIKNADLLLRVDNYEQTVVEIKNQLTPLGGYLVNENVNAQDEQGNTRGYLQIKVPYQKFDSFLASLGTMGKLKNSNIYTQDVTEEFVDVESRLKIMREKEERLIAILGKAGVLSDVLAVENELAHTRAELESLEGRLRYLNNRVDYSTISINLEQVSVPRQNISAGGLEGVFGRAAEAFITTINNLLLGLGKLVVFLFAALPVIIIIALICFIAWRLLKKRRIDNQ